MIIDEQKTNRHKNIGKFISLLTFISYFTVLPAILKPIWPQLLKLSDFSLYCLVILSPNFFIHLFYNLVMIVIYKAKIPFFEKYRNTQEPWPWEEDPVKWKSTVWKSSLTVIFNFVVFGAIMVPLFHSTLGEITFEKSLQKWPSAWQMLPQFLFCMFTQDFIFFWSHYIFHLPQFYWIHKKHHQYNVVISLASTYSHPIQYVVSSVIPTGAGYSILNKVVPVHYVTIIAWLSFRILYTNDAHSGYNWSWRQMAFFPWKVSPEYHDFHHLYNKGNYCSMFSFWDKVVGANQDYKEYMAKELAKQNAEENKVKKGK